MVLFPESQNIAFRATATARNFAYASQIKPKSFESRRNSLLLFFTRGGCASCLRACLSARLLPQSYQYPNLSEGADSIGGQLRGDKECPFSGVNKSGRVWRKVPESDVRSVTCTPPMWLERTWHCKLVWLYGVHKMCAGTAAVSRGTSHVTNK